MNVKRLDLGDIFQLLSYAAVSLDLVIVLYNTSILPVSAWLISNILSHGHDR